MFGNKKQDEHSKPVPAPTTSINEPKYKLKKKISDLNWEITSQPDSGNLRRCFEDGRSEPVGDVNTILLWEILKALSK